MDRTSTLILWIPLTTRLKREQKDAKALGDSRGAPGMRARLSVQFLSFSCSFRENIGQIIGWHPTPEICDHPSEFLHPPLHVFVTEIFSITVNSLGA